MLITETGEGLADSNAYVSLEDATAYHEQRGNTDWTARVTNPAQVPIMTRNLIIATEVINTLYGADFKGSLLTNEQALMFPRTEFTDANGRLHQAGSIPTALKNAVCLLALKLTTEEVTPLPRPNNAGAVTESSLTTGKYQKTTKYSGDLVAEKYIGYGDVEILLASLMKTEEAQAAGTSSKKVFKLGF